MNTETDEKVIGRFYQAVETFVECRADGDVQSPRNRVKPAKTE